MSATLIVSGLVGESESILAALKPELRLAVASVPELEVGEKDVAVVFCQEPAKKISVWVNGLNEVAQTDVGIRIRVAQAVQRKFARSLPNRNVEINIRST